MTGLTFSGRFKAHHICQNLVQLDSRTQAMGVPYDLFVSRATMFALIATL